MIAIFKASELDVSQFEKSNQNFSWEWRLEASLWELETSLIMLYDKNEIVFLRYLQYNLIFRNLGATTVL